MRRLQHGLCIGIFRRLHMGREDVHA
jgi:hypothetical protein